jgi:hypothetical protein
MPPSTIPGVPPDVLLRFGIGLCPREDDGDPMPPAEVLARFDEPRRQAELQRLLTRIDALPPDARGRMVEAFDKTQVSSKLWLIDALDGLFDLAQVELLVLGGWYGVLPLLCNLRLERPPTAMVCVDLGPTACTVGADVIGALYPNVHYHCADVMTYDYRAPGTVVVNTICEHLPDVAGWWRRLPSGQPVALQSNDYFCCPDHVNCVRSLEEMKAQTPLAEILFEGVLPLPLFHRFMLIGIR